jgi:hypothetical protein
MKKIKLSLAGLPKMSVTELKKVQGGYSNSSGRPCDCEFPNGALGRRDSMGNCIRC